MITPPPLVDATPGDPITSEAWNNVLTAIRTVYDALNRSLGTMTVTVKDKADGNPLPYAVVTATPDDETLPVRSGLYAGAKTRRFVIPSVAPAAYAVTVEAGGYATETREVTIADDGSGQDVTVEMTVVDVTFPAPNVFGRFLAEAVEMVSAAGLQIARIVDSHGNDIPPGAIPKEAANAVVIAQVPEPGSPVQANGSIVVGVTAKADFTERVKVPDLRGLTLDEARAKLAEAGLVLGEITSVL